MEDEVLADAIPAPEQVETASPEPEAVEPVKTFSQEEVDALIGKRLAREQRKWERQQQPQQPAASLPPVDDFPSPEAYAEALAKDMLRRRENEAMLETYRDREDGVREKYDDFDQVAYNPNLPVTEIMAQSIQASDIGPDVLYWLGSNPKEAERIARLSPILQAKEIGKLEAGMASSPPVRKTSTAPAPIAPVTARASGAPTYDTTDPRSTKSMSTSEWIEAERMRQIKKYEAQRNR